MSKEYDTFVSIAVKKDPLAFVDILQEQAMEAEEYAPLLREAACVIANLLLTDEEWHNIKRDLEGHKNFSLEEIFRMWVDKYLDDHDPVINYWPHEILPNAIRIELSSGFIWAVQVDENGMHILNNCGRHEDV